MNKSFLLVVLILSAFSAHSRTLLTKEELTSGTQGSILTRGRSKQEVRAMCHDLSIAKTDCEVFNLYLIEPNKNETFWATNLCLDRATNENARKSCTDPNFVGSIEDQYIRSTYHLPVEKDYYVLTNGLNDSMGGWGPAFPPLWPVLLLTIAIDTATFPLQYGLSRRAERIAHTIIDFLEDFSGDVSRTHKIRSRRHFKKFVEESAGSVALKK